MKKNKLIKKLLSDNYKLTKELKRLEREFHATPLMYEREPEKLASVSVNPENNWLPPGDWIIYYGIFATSNQIVNFDIWLDRALEFGNVSYSEIIQRFSIPPRSEDKRIFISSVEQVQKRIHPGDRIDLALSKPEEAVKE